MPEKIDYSKLCIVSGSSNPEVAHEIEKYLKHKLTEIDIRTFADGEIWCQVQDSVRGKDVFLIQSTCSPVNDNLMELLLMIDSVKRASANSITAVIPYYGYARQDRKTKPRVPISSALVAELIEASGAHRVVALDLHCGQIQGFFRCPVDNIYGQPVLADAFLKDYVNENDLCVVSPDAGGAERALYLRKYLKKHSNVDSSFAIMSKKRVEHNKVESLELIGDTEGKICVIVDDMVDTAGTLCKAADLLAEVGKAKKVYACISHGLLNGPAIERIEKSAITTLYILNSVPLPKEKQHPKIKVVGVGTVLGKVIEHIQSSGSVSGLFPGSAK